MAKKRRGRPPGSGRVTKAAESFGKTLGTVAAKVDGWLAQREEIAGALNSVIVRAESLLAQVRGDVSDEMPQVKRGRGRPRLAVVQPIESAPRKRRKMSAATKRKIAAATKARWAKQKAGKGGKAKKGKKTKATGQDVGNG